jgi:mono/diheme cytochrome c family protein
MVSTPAAALEFVEVDRGRGLKLYNNYCIACHGHDGSGSALARADINPDMPVLLAAEDATPQRYFNQIYFGGGGMPQMHDELSPADIWNIVYAIPLIRGRQHSEWVPEKFNSFQLTEVDDGKH